MTGGHDECGPSVEHHEPRPLRSAVHERREWHESEPGVVTSFFRNLFGRADLNPSTHLFATHGIHKDVVLSPEHALGHARGSTRVDDVQIFGGG